MDHAHVRDGENQFILQSYPVLSEEDRECSPHF